MPTQIDGSTGVNKVQDGSVVQADLAEGVVGKGRLFSARASTPQGIPHDTPTKMACNVEDMDLSNEFSTSTYRYTPGIPGHYFVYAQIQTADWSVGANGGFMKVGINKNGSQIAEGLTAPVATYVQAAAELLIYMNGTTDYLEAIASHTCTGTRNIICTRFSAHLVRAA